MTNDRRFPHPIINFERRMMAARIANSAPPGSLFKTPKAIREKQRKVQLDMGRDVRETDDTHLALVRKCPCIRCGGEPSESAHVRMASAMFGKKLPGTGRKPDDRWVVPLCTECHAYQHRAGELQFWHEVGVSPLPICVALYQVTGDLMRMRKVIIVMGGRP